MAPTLDIVRKAVEPLADMRLTFRHLPAGAEHYARTGAAFPAESMDAARAADAILLSAMGLPSVRYADGTEISPQLDLRGALNLFAGVRPVVIFPGLRSPLSAEQSDSVDFVLVRESTEGLFASHGKGQLIDDREARETMVITRQTSEKLFDFAFELAQQRRQAGRGPGTVTCVDKANVFQAFAFFRKIFFERARRHPDLTANTAYVDATALWMVQKPWEFDVLVTENMFGDILSDLGSALMGGLGIAPSADIGDDHAVFQPCHGSAPDIAGKNMANPLAMILSAAMMLDWLGRRRNHAGLQAAGARIDAAVRAVFTDTDVRTADLGGNASTTQMADAVIDRMKGLAP